VFCRVSKPITVPYESFHFEIDLYFLILVLLLTATPRFAAFFLLRFSKFLIGIDKTGSEESPMGATLSSSSKSEQS
jgi:hypothetical protein